MELFLQYWALVGLPVATLVGFYLGAYSQAARIVATREHRLFKDISFREARKENKRLREEYLANETEVKANG